MVYFLKVLMLSAENKRLMGIEVLRRLPGSRKALQMGLWNGGIAKNGICVSDSFKTTCEVVTRGETMWHGKRLSMVSPQDAV
jgi:hypothetical protein